MISIGLSHFDPDHPCSIDELISTADMMMYKDKRLHREDQKKEKEGF
jgi:GGDEF domain-containing protein